MFSSRPAAAALLRVESGSELLVARRGLLLTEGQDDHDDDHDDDQYDDQDDDHDDDHDGDHGDNLDATKNNVYLLR